MPSARRHGIPVTPASKPRSRATTSAAATIVPRACYWCGPSVRKGFSSRLGGLGVNTTRGKRQNICDGSQCDAATVWQRLVKRSSESSSKLGTWGLDPPPGGTWTTCPERTFLVQSLRGEGRSKRFPSQYDKCKTDCPSRTLLQRMSEIRPRIKDRLATLATTSVWPPVFPKDLDDEQKEIYRAARKRMEDCQRGHFDCCSNNKSDDTTTASEADTSAMSGTRQLAGRK